MIQSFPGFYIVIHLFAVIALGIAPFVFFSVYAEEYQEEWTITIPAGTAEKQLSIDPYPSEMPISVGDKVSWKNYDNVSHYITSGLPAHPEFAGTFFEPGLVEPGEKVSYILDNSDFNSFYYFCEIHPWLTGNIIFENILIAKPETNEPIFSEKDSYVIGDNIRFSGKVHQDFADTEYTSLIFNQDNDLVYSLTDKFDIDASFTDEFLAEKNLFETGKYKIKIVYGVPSKVGQTDILIVNDKTVPKWIKNVGDYWCKEQISDKEFIDAVQFLIENNVIHVKNNLIDSSDSQIVPSWIKKNTCWWSESKISDIDFISGLEYLVNIGTIKV